jgi:hypothetical protein
MNRFLCSTTSALGIIAALLLFSETTFAAEEVASAIRRYKEHELSTGYYEEYEVLPRRQRPLVGVPGVQRGIFPYSPSAAQVRIRTRLADSHQGIKFYERRRCEACHVKETRDIHTTSIAHYYSLMNPIRRHAAVCAKCHEGASASFASYVVHTPNPAMAATKKTFPVLFYAFWIMVGIAVGTFVVFLPHTALWGIRELFIKKGENHK